MSIQSIQHALLVACSKNVSIPYAYVICWLSVVLHSSRRVFNSHLSPVFPSIGAIHLAEQAAALILEACLSSDLAMISAPAAGNSFLEWMRVTRLLTIPSGSLFTPRVLREREKKKKLPVAPLHFVALRARTSLYFYRTGESTREYVDRA